MSGASLEWACHFISLSPGWPGPENQALPGGYSLSVFVRRYGYSMMFIGFGGLTATCFLLAVFPLRETRAKRGSSSLKSAASGPQFHHRS